MRGGRSMGRRPGFGAGFARGSRGRGLWSMGRRRGMRSPYTIGTLYTSRRPYPYSPAPAPYYGVAAYPYRY